MCRASNGPQPDDSPRIVYLTSTIGCLCKLDMELIWNSTASANGLLKFMGPLVLEAKGTLQVSEV
jgi:hypothetical protein